MGRERERGRERREGERERERERGRERREGEREKKNSNTLFTKIVV